MFSKQARVRRRLAALSTAIAEDRQRLTFLHEQVSFLEGVESDTATDALVSGPEAAREHTAASRDLARAAREQAEIRARLQRHRDEQDRLLERLAEVTFEDPGPDR